VNDPAPIRSRAHPLVKRVREVRQGKHPGVIVLEGERLVLDALASGLEFECLLVAEDRVLPAELAGHARLRRAGREVLAASSELTTPPGVLALTAAPRRRSVAELPVGPRTLWVIAAGIADPGNLGACARVAEAAGAEAFGTCGPGASPWGSKALRGSSGSLLRLPLVAVTGPAELRAQGLRQVRAATRGGADYRRFDWSGPLALWLSSETGELPFAEELEPVTIPLAGAVESLNVTTAAALLCFAAGRV
jgi:TrmH family RNA methyltransferase